MNTWYPGNICIEPNAIYQHFKGGVYLVMAIAQDSENEKKKLVIYKDIKNQKVYARPIENFAEYTRVDGRELPRFKFIGTI